MKLHESHQTQYKSIDSTAHSRQRAHEFVEIKVEHSNAGSMPKVVRTIDTASSAVNILSSKDSMPGTKRPVAYLGSLKAKLENPQTDSAVVIHQASAELHVNKDASAMEEVVKKHQGR